MIKREPCDYMALPTEVRNGALFNMSKRVYIVSHNGTPVGFFQRKRFVWLASWVTDKHRTIHGSWNKIKQELFWKLSHILSR